MGAIGFAEIERTIFGRGLVAGGIHVEPLDGLGSSPVRAFVEPSGASGEFDLKRDWPTSVRPS